MYDLMGKAVGVPVWQLIGPQQRAYVPVGSWTVSAAPAHMAEAVQRYQARGYVSACMQLPLRRPPVPHRRCCAWLTDLAQVPPLAIPERL